MGFFNIARDSNNDLPEKEKIIQLITEITAILEKSEIQDSVDIDKKVFSQEEYDIMQQTLTKENEALKEEIKSLQDEVSSLQNQPEATIEEPIEQELPELLDDSTTISELKLINDRVTELVRKDTIVQELHSELQKYKAGLNKGIITPILKSLIRCYDRVIECRNSAVSMTDDSVDVILKQIDKEYMNLSLYISDMVYDYDIEVIDVKVGDTYEPKKHKAITTLDTDDANKHNTIAEIKKSGFTDIVLGRVLRHCEVVVYKLENNK